MSNRANGRRGADDGIVIAGGGLAAQRCAETLRRCGGDGPIRIVAAEPHLPYDRPPLSKALLSDGGGPPQLAFRDSEWYRAQGIELLRGVQARRLLGAQRRLETSAGTLRYSRLLIATGGRPRALDLLSGCDGVLTLRSVDDALALRERLVPGLRLAIIGAGFIGLELAASARALGTEVTVIEAAAAPLAGVLGERIGKWFQTLHREHGVTMLSGRTLARVQAATPAGRGGCELRLSDGTSVVADQIVVAVGTVPDVEWLVDSGVQIDGGVCVDRCGRSSLPDVFAAGDAAATLDPQSGRHLPGSHWEAAARQATAAARLMLGLDAPAPQPASFWTDQYGLRIQYVGRARPGDSLTLDGEPREHNFTATYTRSGRVTAVLLVDRPRQLPAARALLQKGQP